MGNDKYKNLVAKLQGKKQIGRSRRTWEGVGLEKYSVKVGLWID
jgi:hypothetical protein